MLAGWAPGPAGFPPLPPNAARNFKREGLEGEEGEEGGGGGGRGGGGAGGWIMLNQVAETVVLNHNILEGVLVL